MVAKYFVSLATLTLCGEHCFTGAHYESTPMQSTENRFDCKNENFHWKTFDKFLIFVQNIDYGYT